MPSLQVLDHSIDRRLVTPERLGRIVDLGSQAGHAPVKDLIGTPSGTAEEIAATVAEQQRFIDFAGEKVAAVLDERILYRQRYRSRQPGSDQLELELPQWPAEAEALEIEGVSLDTYRLNEVWKRYVYRNSGWGATSHGSRITQQPVAGTEIDNLRVDFTAGYLMPGQITPWEASRAYIKDSSSSVGTVLPLFGSWILPTDPQNKLRFECTTAGTTAGTEPVWPVAEPWEAGRAYANDEWALATDGPIGLWFQATTGGTAGDIEPIWPIAVDGTVADNDIEWTTRAELTFADGANLIWTAHFTEELPIALQEICALLAIELLKKIIGQDCEDEKCVEDFRNTAKAIRFAA